MRRARRFLPRRSSNTGRRDPEDRATEAPRARLLRAARLLAASRRTGLPLLRARGLQHRPTEALRHRLHGRRSEEHTSELQSLAYLVCRLLLEKKKNYIRT